MSKITFRFVIFLTAGVFTIIGGYAFRMSMLTTIGDIPQYQEIRYIERDAIRLSINFSEQFAFSPDNMRIAAVSSSTTVNIWDIATGEVLQELTHDNAEAVSWSPDGNLIATGNGQRLIRVWDAETGSLQYELGSNSGTYISWSPDSRYFATDALKIFDARTGDVYHVMQPHWGGVPYEAHWSPDGTMIATTTGWEGVELHIWSTEGQRLDTFWSGNSASWSPDSSRLASTGQIREIASGLPIVIIPELRNAIAWHPNGQWIASTGNEGEIYLWDAVTGERLAMWQYDGCDVNGLDWSYDGEYFAVNCIQIEPEYSNNLYIWELIR